MPAMKLTHSAALSSVICVLCGCSGQAPKEPTASKEQAAPQFFKVDPATAGVLKGSDSVPAANGPFPRPST